MPFIERALAALKRILIVIGIAVAFSVGLIGAIVLSLHSSQTTVPNIVGKDRASAENAISEAGLNFRVRATRPAGDARPDTVLIQVPASGEVVKVGQTVAVDLSRPAREGESSTTTSNSTEEDKKSETTNDRSANNANEEKPRRNRNTNKNANDNQNTNGNRNGNANANPNSNRVINSNANHGDNHNVSPARTSVNTNANPNNGRGAANVNRANSNSNTNRRRPAVSPTP